MHRHLLSPTERAFPPQSPCLTIDRIRSLVFTLAIAVIGLADATDAWATNFDVMPLVAASPVRQTFDGRPIGDGRALTPSFRGATIEIGDDDEDRRVATKYVSMRPNIEAGSIMLVRVPIRVSSVPTRSESLEATRWIVRVRPRDDAAIVYDYWPHTATAAATEGPSLQRTTDEHSRASGLSLDAIYGAIATAHAGTDVSKKQSQSTEERKLPTLHPVISSGTFEGGRGVVFKLDATAQHRLEGEKGFAVDIEVPETWRGGLLDVHIEAFRWEPPRHPLASGHWEGQSSYHTVAAYRSGDSDARLSAMQIVRLSHELADQGRMSAPESNESGGLVDQAATALGHWLPLRPSEENVAAGWLPELLLGRVDPHHDIRIRRQPMTTRMLALDYVDAVDRFERLSMSAGSDESHTLVRRAGPSPGPSTDPVRMDGGRTDSAATAIAVANSPAPSADYSRAESDRVMMIPDRVGQTAAGANAR